MLFTRFVIVAGTADLLRSDRQLKKTSYRWIADPKGCPEKRRAEKRCWGVEEDKWVEPTNCLIIRQNSLPCPRWKNINNGSSKIKKYHCDDDSSLKCRTIEVVCKKHFSLISGKQSEVLQMDHSKTLMGGLCLKTKPIANGNAARFSKVCPGVAGKCYQFRVTCDDSLLLPSGRRYEVLDKPYVKDDDEMDQWMNGLCTSYRWTQDLAGCPNNAGVHKCWGVAEKHWMDDDKCVKWQNKMAPRCPSQDDITNGHSIIESYICKNDTSHGCQRMEVTCTKEHALPSGKRSEILEYGPDGRNQWLDGLCLLTMRITNGTARSVNKEQMLVTCHKGKLPSGKKSELFPNKKPSRATMSWVNGLCLKTIRIKNGTAGRNTKCRNQKGKCVIYRVTCSEGFHLKNNAGQRSREYTIKWKNRITFRKNLWKFCHKNKTLKL